MSELSILNLNGGVIVDLFDEELQQIVNDIADENKKANDKRSISITIDFLPTADRGSVTTTVVSSVKLGKREPVSGGASISRSRDGLKIYANRDLNQPNLDFPNMADLKSKSEESKNVG